MYSVDGSEGVKMNICLGTERDKDSIKAKYPHTCQVLGEGGCLIIAEENEETIGFLWAFIQDIPVVEEKEMFINVVEVFDTQNRCNGVGTALVKMCLSIAKERSCYQVRAYCSIFNVASCRLWHKNGFAISPVKMPDNTIPGSYVTYRL